LFLNPQRSAAMFHTLPTETGILLGWNWSAIEPYYQDLLQRPIYHENVQAWLEDWSRLADRMEELYSRLSVAVAANTADAEAERKYTVFLDEIQPPARAMEQRLKQKLLSSGLEPEGHTIPLRNMRAEADLFRAENLPLLSEEAKRSIDYDKILSAQTVIWDGEERTIEQMQTVLQEADRDRREQAWRLAAERQLADREAINTVWAKLLNLRGTIARNAGRLDYRAYRWQELLRFDYTVDDARRFHAAIEEVVVPAALRSYERRRQLLGVDTLRPWDLDVDLLGLPPLRPFATLQDLTNGASRIFHRVDDRLGDQFDTMTREGLLDLENRKNKAPGAFCTGYPVIQRPYILMNAVGTHDDVQTLLHESGHAFHVFASGHLSAFQRNVPIEFAEVASMAMELLSSPYLTRDQGGFYTPAEAARARIEHLDGSIRFWPYMAVVDAFQHWVYENETAAADPSRCDAAWAELWRRFMPGVDWTGLEEAMETGWHRKPHIHELPFYYIEYGLAQLGAVQVWAGALRDQAYAVEGYRSALALGGAAPLPRLFQAAGARFALDASALRDAVQLMEDTIQTLSQQL
jgi:oligoendopeptidase F